MARNGRKMGNGKPLAKGKGSSPAEYIQRRGWVINPKTGLRQPVK